MISKPDMVDLVGLYMLIIFYGSMYMSKFIYIVPPQRVIKLKKYVFLYKIVGSVLVSLFRCYRFFFYFCSESKYVSVCFAEFNKN